jgi:hypothetical protein
VVRLQSEAVKATVNILPNGRSFCTSLRNNFDVCFVFGGNSMRIVSRPISTVKAIARKDEQARRKRQILLAFAAASALALCSLGMARADTWVTVGPDGSVTRTQTTASAVQRDNGNDAHQNRYPDDDQRAQRGGAVNNTTLYSGTLSPVPYAYPYYNPGGVTYNTQPQFGNFQPPTITTLPSTGYVYGYPPYGYPPYGYPAPVYSYPYPLYGSTGVYYSGPAGGGGTITSSTTTTGNGFGVDLGNRGYNIRLGNRTNTTSSTTTVTTTR